jgi:hypothetical protein
LMPALRQLSSLLLIFVCAGIASAQQTPPSPAPVPASVSPATLSGSVQTAPADGDSLALYQSLQALRLDATRVYQVQDLRLRRGPVSITLTQGRLAFYAPIRGRITGAVFTGPGRVTLLPRQPSEKLSLLRFVGVPLLDQNFSRVYLRFTDDTAADLRRQLAEQGVTGIPDTSFSDPWNAALENLNSWQSLRVLSDLLAAQPRPYFYARLSGDPPGPFDVVIDPRREEPVLVGQPKLVNGIAYYDVWASLPSTRQSGEPPSGEPASGDFQPVSYVVATTIHEDRSLEGETTIKFRCVRAGERTVSLHLAYELAVKNISGQTAGGARQPLEFFQGVDFDSHGASRTGSSGGAGGDILVVLARPSVAGREYELHVTYRGTVISDAGNGVLFVAERGSWYASLPGPDRFTPFDLSFRWPRQLTLVATGKQVETSVQGDMRVGRWITSQPASVAGFNLGEYARQTVKGGGAGAGVALQVDVYANRQLEDAIAQRIAAENATISEFAGNAPTPPEFDSEMNPPNLAPASHLPSPAATLSLLGREILDSIGFFEKRNGPFPFERLAIAQIPGSFGQGWPGLIYLPTLAFLPPEAQQQAGAAAQVQQQLSQLVPFHEVAHQWWGNTVGVESYRDTWILEGMANYLSLMYSDARLPAARVMDNWLESFRRQLTAPVPGPNASPGSNETMESIGPLSLGYRLRSSQAPDAYNAILYGKGTWVIHMLRMMLRDSPAPGADQSSAGESASTPGNPPSAGTPRNPDARFIAVLHDLLEQHRFQPISTADFQHAVENHMTTAMDLEGGHRMDWFFDEWVSQTGLPEYRVEFQARAIGRRIRIRGALFQDGVSAQFTMPVPLYAASADRKNASSADSSSPANDHAAITSNAAADDTNPATNNAPTGRQSKAAANRDLVFLGTVVTTGPETRFQFWLPPAARRAPGGRASGNSFPRVSPAHLSLLIDPLHTLLRLTK